MLARKIFKNALSVIGMVHLDALPGTPKSSNSINHIIKKALREAEIYVECGVDGILFENMHDIPYQQPSAMGPEITATMTRGCSEIRKVVPSSIACGVQILACANKEALAVAHAADLQFIRCEGFVFGHIADEGWTNSCAADLLRYRKAIDAGNVLIFTDIKKKHSAHAVTADVSVADTAAAAEFFLSDGLILTGSETGAPANVDDLIQVRNRSSLPVLIGSGVTLENVSQYTNADALIVGSYFKKRGRWYEDIEIEKVKQLMSKVHSLRN